MINYEIKKINPPTIKLNEDGTALITAGVITGVTGCPYPMIVGDSISMIIEDYATKLPPKIDAEFSKYVEEFIAKKYPNK